MQTAWLVIKHAGELVNDGEELCVNPRKRAQIITVIKIKSKNDGTTPDELLIGSRLAVEGHHWHKRE